MTSTTLEDEVFRNLEKRSGKKVTNKRKNGGRGYRQCPACKIHVHVRQRICECGRTFKAEDKKPLGKPEIEKTLEEKQARKFAQALGYGIYRVMHIPSGACPIKLTKTTKKAVWDWCEDLITYGLERRYVMSQYALRYYSRQFFEYRSAEHTKVLRLIDALAKTYIGAVQDYEETDDQDN